MRFLGRLLNRFDRPQATEPGLDTALERAAAKIDPRIKQTRAWPQRYRTPLLGALTQARRVAGAIPGPVQVDAGQYIRDPLVRALFCSADDVRRSLCSSPALQGYYGGSVYALLSVRRMEKNTLGIEANGDILRRDVLQRLVWFTDLQLSGPAETEAEARRLLLWTLYDRFLERVLIGVQRVETDYQRLLRQKDEILLRLHKAEGQVRRELQRSLENVLRQLAETARALEPETRADIVETVLSHPEDCLYVDNDSVILDPMGVVRSSEDPPATRLGFTQLHERYQEPRTVALIHCTDLRPLDV